MGITATATPQENTSSVTLILRSSPLGSGTGTDIMRFTLPINPADVNIDRPSRQTVTQTLGGAYQDHWGEGLIRIALQGNTGWRPRGTPAQDGYQAILALRDILHEYDLRCAKSGRPNDEVFLYLLLDLPAPRWERFRVSKETVSFTRTRTQPLLYMYQMSFIAVEDLSYVQRTDPSPVFIITTYPLKPPAPVVTTLPPGTTGPGGGGSSGGNGSGNGSGTGTDVGNGSSSSSGTGTGPGGTGSGVGGDAYLDPGVVENTSGATNDWAATNSTVTLHFAGFYIGPGANQTAATLRDLAVLWYGARGWKNPGSLWPTIRDVNPEFFLSSATGSTRIPALAATEIEPQPSCLPDHLRIALIEPRAFDFDGDKYMRFYNVNTNYVIQNVFFRNSGETPGQYISRATISPPDDAIGGFLGTLISAVTHVSAALTGHSPS